MIRKDFDIDDWAKHGGMMDEPATEATELIEECTGLCCCGSGLDFALLLEVLEWCNREDKHDLKDGGCYRNAGWELAAKVLNAADLIEHGSGIGWPWLTPWGKKVLEWCLQHKEQP